MYFIEFSRSHSSVTGGRESAALIFVRNFKNTNTRSPKNLFFSWNYTKVKLSVKFTKIFHRYRILSCENSFMRHLCSWRFSYLENAFFLEDNTNPCFCFSRKNQIWKNCENANFEHIHFREKCMTKRQQMKE